MITFDVVTGRDYDGQLLESLTYSVKFKKKFDQ